LIKQLKYGILIIRNVKKHFKIEILQLHVFLQIIKNWHLLHKIKILFILKILNNENQYLIFLL